MSPVLHAACYHHVRCLRLMIEDLEGKATQKSSDGKPDLGHALMYGPVVIGAVQAAENFSMILRNGEKYLTALHLAVEAGNFGGVDSLVRAGASASIENEDGETAMQLTDRLVGMSKESETILRRLM